jgi:membrane-associated phospholipid phosphatase
LILRLWPPIGLVATLLLGTLVGKGPTALDDWFLRDDAQVNDYRLILLLFTDARLLALIWAGSVVFALWQRRWRMVAVVVLAPTAALLLVKGLKLLFGREKGGSLAYPSGHTTLAVVVLGLAVMVAGWQLWVLLMAAVAGSLGMFGQALTYHYFTDAVGGALLGTSIVCVAVLVAGYTPSVRNPTSTPA